MSRFLTLLLILTLAACGRVERVVDRAFAPPDPEQCFIDLAATSGVTFRRLPPREPNPGCPLGPTLQLTEIGLPVRGAQAMTCPLARATVAWARGDIQPAALRHFGRRVVMLESYGTYACRPVNGVPGGRLSEHARANALDVAGFRLEGGRRVTVLAGWTAADPAERAFLRDVFQGGCRRFRGVIGPDGDARHRDHFHLDMGGGRFCR